MGNVVFKNSEIFSAVSNEERDIWRHSDLFGTLVAQSADGKTMFVWNGRNIYITTDRGFTWSVLIKDIYFEKCNSLLYCESQNVLYLVSTGWQNHEPNLYNGFDSSVAYQFSLQKIDVNTKSVASKTVKFETREYGTSNMFTSSWGVSPSGVLCSVVTHYKQFIGGGVVPHFWAYKEAPWEKIDYGYYDIKVKDDQYTQFGIMPPGEIGYMVSMSVSDTSAHIFVIGNDASPFNYSKKTIGTGTWDVLNEKIPTKNSERIPLYPCRVMFDRQDNPHVAYWYRPFNTPANVGGFWHYSNRVNGHWNTPLVSVIGSFNPTITMTNDQTIIILAMINDSPAFFNEIREPWKTIDYTNAQSTQIVDYATDPETGYKVNKVLFAVLPHPKTRNYLEFFGLDVTTVTYPQTLKLKYFSSLLPQKFVYNMRLYSGWNLIGIPLKDRNYLNKNLSVLISNINMAMLDSGAVEDVWIYESGKTYAIAVKKFRSGDLNLHILSGTDAYFIKIKEGLLPGILRFVGYVWDDIGMIHIKQGHNWINLPSGDYKTVQQLLAKYNVKEVQMFDNEKQYFRSGIMSFYRQFDGLAQGIGYVVVADGNFDLDFTGSSW